VRSRKVTVTSTGPSSLLGGQNKDGLLGQTDVIEEIVPSGTPPDLLSQSVVSSVIEPIDSAKSKKTTIISNGPQKLTSAEKKSGLLGEVNVVESIVPAGTAPDNLSRSIVSSSITSIDSAKSKKTTISSIGPTTLSGTRINERGETETVRQTIVAPGSTPDADSVNIISSEVEPIDTGKSKKTTVSVGSRKTLSGGKATSGLLGRTTVTESIVAAPAGPDSLTWSNDEGIIESSVEPISATKAKKTTITSSGPTKLKTKTLIESQLGLVEASIVKSIVDQNTSPTSSSDISGLKVVKDSINNLDNVKSERELVEVNKWPKNVSVDYDEQLGIGIYYTETIVQPGEYINPNSWRDLSNIDYKSIDQWKSFKKEIDIDKVSQALLSQYYKIPTMVPIDLPNKLLNVIVYLGNSYGAGTDFDITQGANTGSYNLSNSGSTKSSWSIGGDVYFEIEKGFSGSVQGYKHIFFIQIKNGVTTTNDTIINILNNFAQFGSRDTPSNPVPSNNEESNLGVEVLTELSATYQKWPYIKTKTENLVLITGSRSKSDSKSQSESVGINGFASSQGMGASFDVNVNANSIVVPETIHPAITIKVEEVNSVNDTRSVERPETSISPTSLAATDPMTFPTGDFLISADVELYKWGFLKVTATTVTITANEV
jgi:hypothetical protein